MINKEIFYIEVEQLCLPRMLCQNLDLTVKAGDIWAVLGPNGSGKTTLLQTLAGLIPTIKGNIFLKGKKLHSLSPKFIAQELGILLQDTQPIFPQTVFDYCLAGRHPHSTYFSWENAEDHCITNNALTEMELIPFIKQNIQTLSGGERRRLAIATLITQSPTIYLLDEPTNHLDMRHQIKVLQYFKNAAEKNSVGVIMALHDVNLAQQYCNKILMLFGDGTFLQGHARDLFSAENLTKLYNHPFRSIPFENQLIWLPFNPGT